MVYFGLPKVEKAGHLERLRGVLFQRLAVSSGLGVREVVSGFDPLAV